MDIETIFYVTKLDQNGEPTGQREGPYETEALATSAAQAIAEKEAMKDLTRVLGGGRKPSDPKYRYGVIAEEGTPQENQGKS